MNINYIISLDLSTKSTGVAIFDTNKNLIDSTTVAVKKPSGLLVNKHNENMVKVSTMINDIDTYINNIMASKKVNINNQNTIIVFERRLSGFNKFTTNKTIESLAQLSGLAIKHFNVDNGYLICHVNITTWQNNLFGAKKERTLDSKQMSLNFAKDSYNKENITDDEADSICIGHYYLNNKMFEYINKDNVKSALYKTHAKTLKESFSVIGLDNMLNINGSKRNFSISDIIEKEKEYINVYTIDDNMLIYDMEV